MAGLVRGSDLGHFCVGADDVCHGSASNSAY